MFAAAFHGFEGSTIEAKTRALLLLRVAAVDRCVYWRLQFEVAARKVGATDEEITLTESEEWEMTPAFTQREFAAVLWGDRIARRVARRDMKAHEVVRASFHESEFVELTLVASLATMADRLVNSLRIAPEEPNGLSPSEDPLPMSAFAEWSRSMFDSGTLSAKRSLRR